MSASGVTDTVYPLVLVFANLGAGVGLYGAGGLLFALLLWLSGGLVLVGLASALGHRVTESPTEAASGRGWIRL